MKILKPVLLLIFMLTGMVLLAIAQAKQDNTQYVRNINANAVIIEDEE